MAARPMTISRSIRIDADPLTVYRHISDPRRTAGWSPENTGARFDDDAGDLSVGSTFVGTNRRGPFRWATRCVVLDAVPGKEFAFRVGQIGVRSPRLTAPIAEWRYHLQGDGAATDVTEQWTDLRRGWSDAMARAFDFVVTGGSTFAQFNTRNIDTSLRNLKQTIEQQAG